MLAASALQPLFALMVPQVHLRVAIGLATLPAWADASHGSRVKQGVTHSV